MVKYNAFLIVSAVCFISYALFTEPRSHRENELRRDGMNDHSLKAMIGTKAVCSDKELFW